MKTIKILALLTSITFVLTACSKEKNNTESSTFGQIEKTAEVRMDQTDKTTEGNMDQSDKTTVENKDLPISETLMNKGDPAPDFAFLDVAGKEHKLADYAGKKVYIKFWATWCPICLAGLEELNTLAGEEEDFVILTLVSPGYKNEKTSDKFITWFEGVENVSNLKVLLDEDGSLVQELGIRGYPTSAFIGSDGILIKTQPGHVSNEAIKAEFESIY